MILGGTVSALSSTRQQQPTDQPTQRTPAHLVPPADPCMQLISRIGISDWQLQQLLWQLIRHDSIVCELVEDVFEVLHLLHCSFTLADEIRKFYNHFGIIMSHSGPAVKFALECFHDCKVRAKPLFQSSYRSPVCVAAIQQETRANALSCWSDYIVFQVV